MIHPRTAIRPGLALFCATLLAGVALGLSPDTLLQTLQSQIQQGDHAAALVTARQCAEALPDHEAVWYNLAGLEALHGDADAAAAAFERTCVLGFDDFRHADQDDDLGLLRDRPEYARLKAAWADGLAARARSRALTLTTGQWSAPFELADQEGGLVPQQEGEAGDDPGRGVENRAPPEQERDGP